MESEISAYFVLTGIDFEPEEITAKVGIIPTSTWRVGDLIDPRAGIRRKRNGWKLESKLEKSTDLVEHINSVFEQLQPGWLSMVEVCHQYKAEIGCVIYVYGQVPALHSDKGIVEQAAKLNAEIDVDLYVLPDSKDSVS